MPGLGLIQKHKEDLTVNKLKELFPQKKNTITQELCDLINESQNDPEFNGAELVDTMVTYQNVMQTNSGSISQYLDAIKFCAYLETEADNITEAYKRTFPKRDFVIQRANAKAGSKEYNELTSSASQFRKRPMVKAILTQTDMPLYLMFGGARYKAVGVLADMMENAVYDKDKISAADKLLTHVKPPEGPQVELNIGVGDDAQKTNMSILTQIHQMAQTQHKRLMKGEKIDEVQKLGFSKEVIEVSSE